MMNEGNEETQEVSRHVDITTALARTLSVSVCSAFGSRIYYGWKHSEFSVRQTRLAKVYLGPFT